MLYTTFFAESAPYNTKTASVAGDALFATCPLYNLVNSGANYTALCNYTDYRVKKVTLHFMLARMTAGYTATSSETTIGNNEILGTAATKTTFTTNVESMLFSLAWLRSGTYEATPTGRTSILMSALPQCKQWCWNM